MSDRKFTRILIVSDLGIGSEYSLAPDDITSSLVRRKPHLASLHSVLRSEWDKMRNGLGNSVDILVVNGETVDGPQPAAKGKELWTADTNEQCQYAAELIGDISHKELYITKGTPYHTETNTNLDQVVADMLGGWCDWELALQVFDKRFHFAHSIGVSNSAWQYRTTSIARELVAALLQEKEYGKFDGIIRSHAHYFVEVSFGSQWGIVTPCWQGRTPYMIRKGLTLTPKLGYVTMDIYNDGRIYRDWHLFNMPQMQTVTYVGGKTNARQ